MLIIKRNIDQFETINKIKKKVQYNSVERHLLTKNLN